MKVISFEQLSKSDLIIDALYEGGNSETTLGDPISKILLGVGNMGGFRASGRGDLKKFVVLFTSGEDKDWPDSLDLNTGKFIYFGDNKKPGHELHDTGPKGNIILRNIFKWLHSSSQERKKVPPFFIFKKQPTSSSSRSVKFLGLAVPGHSSVTATEDLVAIWKTTNGQRFQNYRATFTILNEAVITRAWLEELTEGAFETENAPKSWLEWRNKGIYKALTSEPTTIIRSIDQQTPQYNLQEKILEKIFEHFKNDPNVFEAFAAKVYSLSDARVIIDEITRGVIDGGRDAIGRYLLGLDDDPVYMEFALEAKCYRPGLNERSPNTVGVKEVSRLISRLRHRQFGVLVTTSVIAKQAYQEVREDRHPVIFISGKDITEILITKGYNTIELVSNLLTNEFFIERKHV